MAIASLIVRIGADIADFEKKISGVERSLTRSGQNLERLGSRLTRGLTLPLTAGIGVAIKAAVDFESTFAGVRKTVDATEDQFKDLEAQFRSLARTMPLSVTEINKVAESAGQLGVSRERIVGFTEAMIKLGATTNLTADEAATSMARFANALGQPDIDVNKLGASLVALGNNGASTEKEILDMAGRIAGAGAQIKLTAGSLFGMANALSSVGIEAEKGGSAISRLFNDLNSAVSAGGNELKNFAAVAGVTAEAFRGLFRKDSAAAITAFIEGLHAQKAAGTDLLKVLDELGITELRYRDTVLLAANAGPQFAASIRLGNEAFAEGSALNKEYTERLKTTASQFAILKNAVNDVLITLGQAFLPIINDLIKSAKPMVEALADAAIAFRQLPEGVRATTLAFAGLLASLGPVLFVVGSITNAMGGVVKAFRFFLPEVDAAAVASGRASGVFSGLLGTVGKFAGPIGVAVTALIGLKQTYDAFSRSIQDGARAIADSILGISEMETVLGKLGEVFPRLKAVMDDVMSIVKNSMILAFRELAKSIDILRDSVTRTIGILGQQFQPVLDAIGVSWDRVSRVIQNVVIPAVKAVAAAFIASLPPVQSFLLLLSKVPGFSDIEQALDRVAKDMERMAGTSKTAADGVSGLGVVFKGGVISADTWSTALANAGNNLTFASSASLSFGPKVESGVVKPLKLGGGAADDFSKKLKSLKDDLAGVDLLSKAKMWAIVLKDTSAQAAVLSDQKLRQDLLEALDAVTKRFGSLEKAGVGSLSAIQGKAKAVELAMEPLKEIPITFQIRGLDTGAFSSFGKFDIESALRDVIPPVPRTSLSAPLIAALRKEFERIDFKSVGAEAAIQRVKDGTQQAIESVATSVSTPMKGVVLNIRTALENAAVDIAQHFASGLLKHLPPSVTSAINGAIAAVGTGGFSGLVAFGKRLAIDTAYGFTRELIALLPKSLQGVFNQALGAFQAGGLKGLGQFAKDFGKQFATDFLGEMLSFVPGVGKFLEPLAAPIVNFFSGLFNRTKGRDMLQHWWDTTFGGFENLQHRLEALGPRGQQLLDQLGRVGRNNAQQAEQAIRDVTAALSEVGTESEQAAKHLQELGVAVEGVNKRAELFTAPFRKLIDAINEADGDELDSLKRQLMATAQAGQEGFERLGVFVAATFAGIVRESGNALDAIKQLAPSFKVLQEGVTDFGLTSTATIDSLLRMFSQVNDAVMGPILESIQATGQIFSGLQDAGYMTSELFQTVSNDIGESFRRIEAAGGDVAVAMALSQPVLQRLWEAQQIYGRVTDETTGKILEQAEQQGIVGAHMKDVNQKILDVLIAIADVFGAKLPDSLLATSAAATDAARSIEREFSDIRIPPIWIPIEYDDPGFDGTRLPALASGGIVRRPTLALVGEAGPEAVVPLSSFSGSSFAPDDGDTTIILELDSRQIAEAVVPQIPGVVRRYGLA